MKIFDIFKDKFSWVIIIACLVVFGNSLSNSLLWDDHAFIENQDHDQITSIDKIIQGSYPVPDTGSYRPVRNALYAITLPTFKTNPFLHHFIVLLLHIFISLQVYILLKLLTKNKNVSFIGSFVFALHPLHTESINWVTAGYDLLFVVFALAAIFSHLNQSESQSKKISPSYIYAALAFFTNEIALVLPIIIMAIDYYAYQVPIFKQKYISKYLIYILIAGIYLVIRMNFVTKNPFETSVFPNIFQNLFLGFILFGQYIYQSLLPTNLSADHFFQPGLTGLYSQNHNLALPPPNFDFSHFSLLIPLILSFIWIMAMLISMFKKSPLSLPLLWMPISLVAVLRVIPLPAIYSERYAYFASIGFVLLLSMITKKFIGKQQKNLTFFILIIIFIVFGSLSFLRNKDWNNDYTLWTKTLSQNPESATANSSLGVQYYLMGDMEKSLQYHQKAIKLNPYISSYQQNYVSILVKLEKYDEIIDFINLILKTDSKNVNLYTILASTYDAKGNYDQAMAYYQKAYDLSPINSPARKEIENLVEELDRKYQKIQY